MNADIHPSAIIEPGATVGLRTRIWAFAHILPGAIIGEDCNICDNVFVEGNVVVGNRTTVKCGVQLWSGLKVGHDVFIGPNATFTNDRFPRSRRHLGKHPETILEDGCSIGANSTILPGLVIGRSAMVGAGSVVTKSVPAYAIVTGNPAEIAGYDCSVPAPKDGGAAVAANSRAVAVSSVRGVVLREMPLIEDLRGDLTVGEFHKDIPFTPKRYFLVFNVRNRQIRGEHAHRSCEQFLVCVSGSCHVAVDDGNNRQEFCLDTPTQGLFLPVLTWGTQYRFSEDGVLLVFASHLYDPSDYIRDYAEFRKAVGLI